MSEVIIVAILSLIGTLIGSFGGIVAANRLTSMIIRLTNPYLQEMDAISLHYIPKMSQVISMKTMQSQRKQRLVLV